MRSHEKMGLTQSQVLILVFTMKSLIMSYLDYCSSLLTGSHTHSICATPVYHHHPAREIYPKWKSNYILLPSPSPFLP